MEEFELDVPVGSSWPWLCMCGASGLDFIFGGPMTEETVLPLKQHRTLGIIFVFCVVVDVVFPMVQHAGVNEDVAQCGLSYLGKDEFLMSEICCLVWAGRDN